MHTLTYDVPSTILSSPSAPAVDCALCPRLAAHRAELEAVNPERSIGPVPSFGPAAARVLIVGPAPWVACANAAGAPVPSDDVGHLLYPALLHLSLGAASYGRSSHGSLTLSDIRITSTVRCAPPRGLPEPAEVLNCNRYLASELASLPNLRAVVALGLLAHAAVLRACGIPPARIRFAHGAIHQLPDGLILADSDQVSRNDTLPNRLTQENFQAVLLALLKHLDQVD